MNVDKKPQLNSLQGLRVVAMFMIFMNHSFLLVQKGKFFDYGARGVEIFFVLAGFLVAYNYFDKATDGTWNDCWCYLIHKFKKFYLLHILTMLLASYWSLHKIAIGGGNQEFCNKFFTELALNITLLKSWYNPMKFSLNGVSWFLSTILLAYFLVPKITKFLQNRPYVVHVCLFIGLFILKFVLDTWGYRMPHRFVVFSLYVNPAYRLMDFYLGYLAFVVSIPLLELRIEKWKVSILQVVLCVLYGVSVYRFPKYWFPAPYILLTSILVIALCQQGVVSSVMGNSILVGLGGISFEFFMLHQVLQGYINAFNRLCLSNCLHGLSMWLVYLIVPLVCAWLWQRGVLRRFR